VKETFSHCTTAVLEELRAQFALI